MIDLLTYPPAFGLASSSPFCIKAAYLLNLSGQQWAPVETLDPRKMPHGKLPVIRTEGRMIADSDNIRAYLEENGADFDKHLSDLDRANARAFIRMAEEHLYFHLVMERWADDQVWPMVRDTYFSEMPAGVRHLIAGIIRKGLLKGLYHQGLGRLSADQRLARIEPDIDAITTRLWQGEFLFGDRPSAADASVAPMLSAIMVTPGGTRLKERLVKNEVLTSYVSRVEAACG